MKSVTISTLKKNIKYYIDEVTQSPDTIIVEGKFTEKAIIIMSKKDMALSLKTNKKQLSKV